MAGESASQMARQHRDKAAWHLQKAEHYERGARGEAATAAALGALPAGWTVLHDVSWPGRPKANIDHVVVGPGGVFVVDSKNWSGRTSLDDGLLRSGGRPQEATVAAAAEAALAVARLTTTASVTQVSPVLCFTQDEPLQGWARDVMVTSTSTLTRMLLSRPPVLHTSRVGQVVAEIERGLHRSAPAPARSSAPVRGRSRQTRGARPATPSAASPRPRSRKRRGAGRELRGLVVLAVVLAALWTGVPQTLLGEALTPEPAGQQQAPASPPAVDAVDKEQPQVP